MGQLNLEIVFCGKMPFQSQSLQAGLFFQLPPWDTKRVSQLRR